MWCCDSSTFFTEHEKNHQTSNLYMKYSGEHNERQCPDHRQTFAANSCVCVFSSHLFWTSISLEVPAGVTQNLSSTFLLRCVPLFFSREGFSRSFPSSTVKSNCGKISFTGIRTHVPTCQKVTRLSTELPGKKTKEKEKKNNGKKQKQKKHLTVVASETLFTRNSKLIYNTESSVMDVCNSNSIW